jgi:hypothetical protein
MEALFAIVNRQRFFIPEFWVSFTGDAVPVVVIPLCNFASNDDEMNCDGFGHPE